MWPLLWLPFLMWLLLQLLLWLSWCPPVWSLAAQSWQAAVGRGLCYGR